jgi:hypothetical protein
MEDMDGEFLFSHLNPDEPEPNREETGNRKPKTGNRK